MAQEGLVLCAGESWKVMVPTRFSFSGPTLLHLLCLYVSCKVGGGRGEFFVLYERLKG